MLLLIAFLGCGKNPAIPDSGVRSSASVGSITMLEGNYGIENSFDCNGNLDVVVGQTIGQIQDCHNSVLRVNPNAKGMLNLEAKIIHGKVMSVKTASNATGAPELSTCLEGIAKSWKFATACTAMTSVSFNLSAK